MKDHLAAVSPKSDPMFRSGGCDWFEMNEAAKAGTSRALYKFHAGLAYFPPYKPAPSK
jgi:hypothetical protein